MKTITLTTIAFLLCCTCWLACNKNNDSTPNLVSCATNGPLIFIHSSSALVLPDAFTPNADGHNDVFLPTTSGIDTIDFSMSIIEGGDAVIFQTNKLTTGWGGQTINGTNATPGIYDVDIKFRTLDGLIKDTCSHVTLLGTNTTRIPNCIITNGNIYYFPDQIDQVNPALGFDRPTQDMVACP